MCLFLQWGAVAWLFALADSSAFCPPARGQPAQRSVLGLTQVTPRLYSCQVPNSPCLGR